MERLSHGPFGAGWSRESNPQAKGQLWGIPAWEQPLPQARHKSWSRLWEGLLSRASADSALGVSGDTRDNLQDSWGMGRPNRAIKETREGGKTCARSRASYMGREAGENPSRTSTQPP